MGEPFVDSAGPSPIGLRTHPVAVERVPGGLIGARGRGAGSQDGERQLFFGRAMTFPGRAVSYGHPAEQPARLETWAPHSCPAVYGGRPCQSPRPEGPRPQWPTGAIDGAGRAGAACNIAPGPAPSNEGRCDKLAKVKYGNGPLARMRADKK